MGDKTRKQAKIKEGTERDTEMEMNEHRKNKRMIVVVGGEGGAEEVLSGRLS